MKDLLARGADVNARDDRGLTPLMYAAQRGYARLVSTLRKAGADASIEAGGKRAVDFATGKRADQVRAALA